MRRLAPSPARRSRRRIRRSAASDDSVEAIRINPANLGWMPSWELRYIGVACDGTQLVNCGHVLEAGRRVRFGFSTAARVDYIMPPASADPIYANASYAWLTWALSWKLNDMWSFGASIQGSLSESSLFNGMFGVTLGASFRPDPHLGLSLVVADLNRQKGPALPNQQPLLDRSYTMAAALRPWGTRALRLPSMSAISRAHRACPAATFGFLARASGPTSHT